MSLFPMSRILGNMTINAYNFSYNIPPNYYGTFEQDAELDWTISQTGCKHKYAPGCRHQEEQRI
jgi:hypothetical protein